ncbi:hypothetical protein DFH09DRAFT_1372285 [Mycena vulgaris]|nr:hypothetical protein DFH09DRAFT_1372285 [Mycena vulgaris]
MAGNPNTVVVLGPTPESYYVGYGRRHFVENMSPSFTNHAKTALNITMSQWISMSKNGDTWIDYNVATDSFHFNAEIDPTIRDHLSGSNGKAAAEYVSFPNSEDRSHFFVNGKTQGAWTAVLPDYYIKNLTTMQREVPNFDRGIRGVLFGKGKTNITLFQEGFLAEFDDDEIKDEEHPLVKTLIEISREDGWYIDRGSTLCFYDSRFYFLKFKKAGNNTTRMRWNLPVHVSAKLAELKEIAQQPEEQIALMQEGQMWMQVAQTRLNNQVQLNNMTNNNQVRLNNMMNNTIHRGGLSFLAAATGGTIVEVERSRYF